MGPPCESELPSHGFRNSNPHFTAISEFLELLRMSMHLHVWRLRAFLHVWRSFEPFMVVKGRGH